MATNLNPTRRIAGERGLYMAGIIVAASVVFAGFARTYYLKHVFGTPALPLLLHVHGLVMSSWFALLFVQSALIRTHRVDVHRKLGVAGVVLAALVVIMGVTVAFYAARHGFSPKAGIPPLAFFAIPLTDMVVFATLVTAGISMRRRSDYHRRLMLLASLGILTAAFARIQLQFIIDGGIVAAFLLTYTCVIACVVFDTVKNRRLHPAFGWGAALIIVSWPLRLALSGTAAWMTFAAWVTG